MIKLLADENISSETVEFLRQRGLDVKDVYEAGLQGHTDEEIIQSAAAENRVILTFDLDFGEMYYFREKPVFGVIVLRIEPQIPNDVNRVLEEFLFKSGIELGEYKDALIVVGRQKFRIRQRS